MYKVQPKGLNIKQNDRNVPDGFLQESINLQWKDGALRPIPDRLFSGIPNSTSITGGIIMHKVSDEDQVNVLTFSPSGVLSWYGNIINGVYSTLSSVVVITDFPTVTDFDSLSFTILNGLIYFMSSSQEFYYRLQYNQTNEEYELKNMYAWKSLIPYYPLMGAVTATLDKGDETSILSCLCGVIAYRFTLVLKTGEEVLHSPIYAAYMYSINTYSSILEEGAALKNIHAYINTNLEFSDSTLFEDEISAINVYASVPYYISETNADVGEGDGGDFDKQSLFSDGEAKSEIQRMAEEPFYLVKTLNKPGDSVSDSNIIFYAGVFNTDIDYGGENVSKVNTDTIAAGSVIPVDNYSYHKLYGKITSNNGRLIINSPKTVLSEGCMRALAITSISTKQGFKITTEDGDLTGIAYSLDKGVVKSFQYLHSRGILSYPDSNATQVGGSATSLDSIYLYNTRKNNAHNMACAFEFEGVQSYYSVGESGTDFTLETEFFYIYYVSNDEETVANPTIIDPVFYDSNNRMQLSEFGEYSVWPVANSYRIGEGKIMFIGSNSIDPANTDYISPLLIGASDGIYTANYDTSGENVIQSITKIANLPALSDKNVQIDQNLVYVSDKGLIVINNGKVENITEEYFPDKGNGDFSDNDTIYPNYGLLTVDLSGNDYQLSDIVDYMKGAIFSYDGRRNNIWCSNPDEDFSLIYNLQTKQWTMSTYVFNEVIDFNSVLSTDEGDIYSRFLVRISNNAIFILSGEDSETAVNVHLLTRAIKIQNPDQYKKIERLISRCTLYKTSGIHGFTFGVWGKQDVNKDKISIPLIAYVDDSSTAFPDDVRQDIPLGRMKGKYKTITILQGGLVSPNSSIDYFEITAFPVENNILR